MSKRGIGSATTFSEVKEERRKHLNPTIVRESGTRGWKSIRPLFAAAIVGVGLFMAGNNFHRLEVPEARAEQAMTSARVRQVQARRAAFEAAAEAVTTYFTGNFGPGTDGEGLPPNLAVDPGTRPNQRTLSNLIDATAALYESLGHPIEGLPPRSRDGANTQERLAIFNRWLAGRLGTTRQDTDAITPDDLTALRRVALFDVDDLTTVRQAAADLSALADRRAAALATTDDGGSGALAAVPRPVSPPRPSVAAVTPRAVAEPDVSAGSPAVDTVAPVAAGPLEEADATHRARMVSRLSEVVGLARGTLTAITSARSGTEPFPAELATRLQGELSRRIQNLSPYLTEADRQATLQPQFVEDQREGLSELSESIRVLLGAWRYSRAHLPAGERERSLITWRIENAVNILTNPDFDPFRASGAIPGYREELQGLLGGQYEERVRARSGGDASALITELSTLDTDSTPEAVRRDVRDVVSRLRRNATSELRRRAGELLVEHDLLRAWSFRYDAAEYQAFRAIEELAPELDADGERAASAIGRCHATLERIRLYYSDLGGRITAPLDGNLESLSEARRLELARQRLSGTSEYLESAISAFEQSGFTPSSIITHGGNRVEVGAILTEARELQQAATTMLAGLDGSVEDVQAAVSLSERLYAASLNLSAIGMLGHMFNERARFSSAETAEVAFAFEELQSSVSYFMGAFGNPADETYYPNAGTVIALDGVEALASSAMFAFGRAGIFNSSFVITPRVAMARGIAGIETDIEAFGEQLGDAELREMQEEIASTREALSEFNQRYDEHVQEQIEREVRFFRLMASLRTSTDFIVPLLGSTDTGAEATDVYLDYRHERGIEIYPMARLRSPFEDHIDDAVASDGGRHRRIESSVVDRAGRLFGQVERERRISEDTNAPEVLRAPLTRIPGFEQLDIPAIQRELSAIAAMYESGASYEEITARSNALDLRILDLRIAELDVLIRTTAEPTDAQQLRYYQRARSRLDEARAMRQSDVPESLRARFADEAIAVAEDGMVDIGRIPGFGTYQPPALSQFFVQLRSRPRRVGDNLMIVVEHTLVRTPDHPDGIDIQELQDSGSDVGRLWYGYLVSEYVPGTGHLIRNPRYDPEHPDPAQPRWLGWIDTRADLVRPMRPIPSRVTPDSTLNIRDYIQFDEVGFRLDPGRDEPGQPVPDMSDAATVRLLTDLAHTPAVEEPGSRYRSGERRGDVMTGQEFGIDQWGAGTRVGVYVRRLFRRSAATAETEETE